MPEPKDPWQEYVPDKPPLVVLNEAGVIDQELTDQLNALASVKYRDVKPASPLGRSAIL